MRPRTQSGPSYFSVNRLRIWYGVLVIVFAIFAVRLFYLQIIRHNFYSTAAFSGQFKEYQIPAERGVIMAMDGKNEVPIVLNEEVFTVFADPKFITNPKEVADKLQPLIGGETNKLVDLMKVDSRYSILAKKVPSDKAKQIDELNLKGVGTRATSQRVYPQGSMAAQILGFVNDEGEGKYGVEQFLDSSLRGKPGELRAITDAQGVPLVANRDNVLKEPENGERTTLTIDVSMQRRVEDMLKNHLSEVKSSAGSVVIMNPKNGEIKALANYPTYNPSEFYKVEDPRLFTNSVVSEPLEVGSVMKALTVAAGMDSGAISQNMTYYDPGFYKIGDATVRNVEEDGGAATRSTSDILRYSLNTGATYVLMQMGGGKINEKARVAWHSYLVDRFMFGKKTGIEQGYEAEGSVPDPVEGFGLEIQYANTTFGQGIMVSPIQMLSAFSATINGGTYYKPHVLKSGDSANFVVAKDIIRPELSPVLRSMHENSVVKNYTFLKRDGYRIGGKTGTAEITKPGGGYYDDRFNGTFVGYVGGDQPEYVIMVTIIEPKNGGYAGRAAAAPMFGKVADMLIGNYAVNKVSN